MGTTPGMNGDYVKALRTIKAKTLIMTGVKDLLNPEWEALEAARYIRDVRTVTINPDSITGHFAAGGFLPPTSSRSASRSSAPRRRRPSGGRGSNSQGRPGDARASSWKWTGPSEARPRCADRGGARRRVCRHGAARRIAFRGAAPASRRAGGGRSLRGARRQHRRRRRRQRARSPLRGPAPRAAPHGLSEGAAREPRRGRRHRCRRSALAAPAGPRAPARSRHAVDRPQRHRAASEVSGPTPATSTESSERSSAGRRPSSWSISSRISP